MKRLLVKRKSKEGFEFIMHYIEMEELNDMGSKIVNEIYTTFKPVRELSVR